MTTAFFVTGTDTEVGKTTVAAGLLHAARKAGFSTAAAKPVASGCELTADGLRNGDALALLGECSLPMRYEQVNPFAFEPAIAPHLAAREVGIELTAALMAECWRCRPTFHWSKVPVAGACRWQAARTCRIWR